MLKWLFGKTRQRRYNKDARRAKKETRKVAKGIKKWMKRTR